MKLLLAFATMFVLIAAGCGASGPGVALEDFVSYNAAGNYEAAYQMLSSKSREVIPVSEYTEQAGPAMSVKPEITGVEIEGDRAVVYLKVEQGEGNVELVRESGEWKIDFSGVVTDQWRSQCRTNIQTVDAAIQAYEGMFDGAVYPEKIEQLTQPGTRVLQDIPTCPAGDKPYIWVQQEGSVQPHISCPNCANHTI